MRLIHQDGRYQTVPDASYQRHLDTYTRAGWRPTNQRGGEAVATAADGVRIRSKHNEERTVGEEDFAATYEPAGWVRADDAVKPAENGQGGEGATGSESAVSDAQADAQTTRGRATR